MPRRMKHTQGKTAYTELFIVAGDVTVVTGLGHGAEYDRSACCPCKVHMSAHKISVKMRFKYILQLIAVRLQHVQVRPGVTERINDRSFPAMRNIIGALRQAIGV